MLLNVLYIVLGAAVGVLGGVIGIGGGVLLVPALIFLFGYSQKDAQGTSLAMMIPPIGILAAITYFKAGHVRLLPALLLAAGFVGGGLIGAKIAVFLPGTVLRKVFAVFLMLVAMKLFFSK